MNAPSCLPWRGAGQFFRLSACFAVLCFALAVSSRAQSTSGSLTGKIRDASGAALPGAVVTIANTDLETSTDTEGEYYFGNVPEGAHTLHVSYLGLPSKDESMSVSAGQRVTVNVTLGTDAIQMQTITVEGSRSGQAKALNLQRAAESLKEMITADAIGRFPDQNMSETLQRMSSIALERDQGDGRFISIRGLNAELNNTQLNGVNVPSSENGTRRVNFDSMPTDLLDGVELTKAVTPDMDGDAIGGTVNLKTKTAFSQEGRVLNLSAEGQYNDFKRKWGHKFSGTYGQRFASDKWGFIVSLSDAVKYHKALDSEVGGAGWALKNGFLVPNNDIDIREYDVRRIRQGVSGSLDFHPTKEDQFYLRGTYNHFSDTEHRYRELFRDTVAATTPLDATHGNVVNRPIRLDIKDRTEDQNFWTVSAGGENHRGPLTIDYLAAYSLAELPDPHRFEYVFQSGNTSWSYDFTNPYLPKLSGPYQTAITPNSFTLNSARLRHALQQDKELTLALNVRGDVRLGELPGYWKAGGKYRQREKTSHTDDLRYLGNSAVNLGTLNLYRPSTFRVESTNPFLTIDEKAFDAYFHTTPGAFVLDPIASALGTAQPEYDTNEDVAAGYGMASVTRGNFTLLGGLRVEQTYFKTSAFKITAPGTAAQTFTPVKVSRDYTNWLPGLHGRYKLGKQVQFRASYTETISRPRFGFSNAAESIDLATNTDTRGNPHLKPFESQNVDVAVEYYPKALGVWSLGVFDKSIKNFIFTQFIPGAGQGGSDLSTPLNGESARIRGLEITWQQNFTMLPSPFDGLSLYSNCTLTDSHADYGDARPGERLPLTRSSKKMANLALAYEKYGFFVRVALNYRSPYLDDDVGQGLGANVATDTWVDDHTQIDVSTNYRVTRQITLYAEALNVNKAAYLMRWGHDSTLLRKAEYYRPNINVGVRYKL
jgi:TonB-dependent receptor